MAIRVGINGFGRIGRALLRLSLNRERQVQVVAVNDLTDNAHLAHLLKYDTVWRRLAAEVTADDSAIYVDGRRIHASAVPEPARIPWSEFGVDIVVDCTGKFTQRAAAAAHLDAGARKVVLSGPSHDADGMFVLGVNHEDYDASTQHVISNASCTTNCLAPLAKALDEAIGIESGIMNTVHAYTGDQRLVDSPHKDFRRARAAAQNIVPTTTGAAAAVSRVYPALAGRLDGFATRVPVLTGSFVDLTFLPRRSVSAAEVNAAVKTAAVGPLHGILDYTEDPIVSSDIVMDPHSSIFDAGLTRKVGELIKVVSWYDNEWGYANRLFDLTAFVGEQLA